MNGCSATTIPLYERTALVSIDQIRRVEVEVGGHRLEETSAAAAPTRPTPLHLHRLMTLKADLKVTRFAK